MTDTQSPAPVAGAVDARDLLARANAALASLGTITRANPLSIAKQYIDELLEVVTALAQQQPAPAPVVQEPAGAVEALKPCPFCGGSARITFVSDFQIISPRTGRRVVCSKCPGQTGATAFEHEAVAAWNNRTALASLQPVTQTAASNWQAVPGVVWYEDSASLIRRGSEDDYCARKGAQRIYFAAAEPVTQAKSKAVAKIINGTLAWNIASPTDAVPVELLRGEHPLYTAPQEAVERQPLTREIALLLAAKVDLARDYNNDGDVQSTRREYADITDSVLAFAQAVENFHGIGPATQEVPRG
jgi:Lar family restriction alleviation protein